jgi:hypothetical protein
MYSLMSMAGWLGKNDINWGKAIDFKLNLKITK